VQLAKLRRAHPDTNILRDLIASRAAATRSRATSADARARHEHMLTASPAYAAATTSAQREQPEAFTWTSIQGLSWCVPLDSRLPERPTRVQRQDLPLRAILNTREVAVGHTMIDIGANLGRTAIPRVILGDVQVAYCAEPDPGNYGALVRTVIENGLTGLVLPDQVALGAVAGEALLVQSQYPGGHALAAADASLANRQTVKVPVVTLDDWVQRLGIDLRAVAFVKVDVQGWEPQVLRGAHDVIAQPHIAWQLEVDPTRLTRAGNSVESLVALLEAHFDRFVDLTRTAGGPRRRAIAELRPSLEYLTGPHPKTDLLLYRSANSMEAP
jgi:FkbM family methyltransferase